MGVAVTRRAAWHIEKILDLPNLEGDMLLTFNRRQIAA